MRNILVVGALGQIGSEISAELRRHYGCDHVVLTDVRRDNHTQLIEEGPFYKADARDAEELDHIVHTHHIDTIFHLAALLSAVAEANPLTAWQINIDGLLATLEVARYRKCRVFIPSSIAAFGPESPLALTPQTTIQRPTSMYGITKVAGELLGDYYHQRYGIDTRGIRYPGIISHETLPGGGTTDYAVHIYYDAITHGNYASFLSAGTYLDMLYMPDAVRAAIEFMQCDEDKLVHRNAYNISGVSVEPTMIARSIQKYLPKFELTFDIDPVRQGIADSWPDKLDDSCARREWAWQPRYDLDTMTEEMLTALSQKLLNKSIEERSILKQNRNTHTDKPPVNRY